MNASCYNLARKLPKEVRVRVRVRVRVYLAGKLPNEVLGSGL